MKKITLTFFLTFLVNVVCLPLWTEYEYGDFVRTLFNKEARLDLLYHGKITGAEPFSFQSTPQPSLCLAVYEAERNIRRANLSLRARWKWQKISLQLEALQDGKIGIFFRGPQVRDEYGQFHSVLTDWKNLKINGTIIFKEAKTLSCDNKFVKEISVRKGDIFQVETEFRRHHFSIHDFTFLKFENLWYFITGNLLFFFLVWRISSALANHHRHTGLSDTLLLVAFFCCLFVPMMDISDGVRSQRENRMLAVKPALKEILKGKINTGGGYEEWFNDHFCGRVSLIKIHDTIRNMLSRIIRTKNALYFKEGGWLFGKSIVQYWDFSPSLSKSIVQNLIQLNQFCEQNKIKLYVLEVPRKEHIYKDVYINKFGFDEKKFFKISQAQESIRNEVRKYHIPYVYPYKALLNAAKRDFVFFKWSHHWTDWGAFVGYCELMKEVRRDFPDMPIVSLNDYQKSQNRFIRDEWHRNYWLGFTERFFNFSDDSLNRSLYSYYDHRDGDKMTVKVGKYTKDFSYPEGRYKIMLMGRSHNDNLTQFLPYSAAQTRYIRLNMGQTKDSDLWKILKLYRNDILSFKPDILILSMSTEALPKLHDICSTK